MVQRWRHVAGRRYRQRRALPERVFHDRRLARRRHRGPSCRSVGRGCDGRCLRAGARRVARPEKDQPQRRTRLCRRPARTPRLWRRELQPLAKSQLGRRIERNNMGIAWHAPYEVLKPETRDMARAIHSLMEELEAIDWYGQRADVCDDDDLRRTLVHNQNEEKEHAAMVLEWIRRHDPEFDRVLKEYLFTSGDLLAVEAAGNPGSDAAPSPAAIAPVPAAA